MKRYNKQQVMKDAHRLYNNDFQRKGRTWSECLRAAWSWEKDAVQVREEKAARLDAMIAASWFLWWKWLGMSGFLGALCLYTR